MNLSVKNYNYIELGTLPVDFTFNMNPSSNAVMGQKFTQNSID